ncbi:hypothetical protein PAXINDRAFT_89211, partial [Paxillus involutus ATCC 200175]
GERGNKLSIEVAEAEEGPYGFYVFRNVPLSDSIKFDRVHLDNTFFKDQSEVVNFFDIEFAFLQFQVEVMFFKSF